MSDKEIMSAIAQRLAKAELDHQHLEGLAKMVSSVEHKAIGLDICKYGICLDLMVDLDLSKLDLGKIAELAPGKIRDIEIFPWGIVHPDFWRLRIAQEF